MPVAAAAGAAEAGVAAEGAVGAGAAAEGGGGSALGKFGMQALSTHVGSRTAHPGGDPSQPGAQPQQRPGDAAKSASSQFSNLLQPGQFH